MLIFSLPIALSNHLRMWHLVPMLRKSIILFFSLYKLLSYLVFFECEGSEKQQSLKYIEVVMQFLNISTKKSCRSRKFFYGLLEGTCGATLEK